MNKIEKLIEHLSPEGVPFLRVGDVAKVGTGSSNRDEMNVGGIYPLYVRSKDILTSDTFEFDEESIVIPGEGGVGEVFHYVNGKYALHQRAYRIAFHDSRISTKYSYYIFQALFKAFISQKAVSATVTSIRKPMIENFLIPTPPIAVQQEIVSILDKFTELEAALEAELDARTKQYEFFRSKLVENKPLEDGDNGSSVLHQKLGKNSPPLVPLGELVRIRNGKDYKHLSSGEIPVFGSGGIMTHVAEPAYDKPSVLIPRKGSLGNLFFVDKPFWTVDTIFWTEIGDRLEPKFLYYFLKTQRLEELNLAGGVPSLTQTTLNSLVIPVPQLEIQREVVALLDAFSSMISNIETGLPAEITARRQQYEYYRNKLLTFKELKAS
jgi:type I restriction enzyme S subunit